MAHCSFNGYYKHFSDFKLECESIFDTKKELLTLTKIKECTIYSAYCAEQDDGFAELVNLICKKTKPVIDSYNGFKIIRIGVPCTINIYDEKAEKLMHEDLDNIKNNGLMAYWDKRSVAFVTNDYGLCKVISTFLENVKIVEKNNNDTFGGIILK